MTRPLYEALDGLGLPFPRPARVVGELPTPQERLAALVEALPRVAEKIGRQPVGPLKFGSPVFVAFMTRQAAKNHPSAKLLLTSGDDLSLDFCPSYEQEAVPA